jgi:hypothetical protein
MSLVAFLHGYPPFWSMGGETSTHRTLRTVPGSMVFTNTPTTYRLDGVKVMPIEGVSYSNMIVDAESVGASVLFGHSVLSQETMRAAKRMKLPSILAVHAPPRYGTDLRRAWNSATVRLYNTEVARREWKDRSGLLLHPPVGVMRTWSALTGSRHDALTITSSLTNKGASRVLALAALRPGQRFIVVESPAHPTHGDPGFWEAAEKLPNVEVWPRLHPDEMHRLWAETRILLVPSRYETYGMAAMEAAWHGIPSVHVDTPHVREGIGTAARLLTTTRVEELDDAVSEIEYDYTAWSDRAFQRASTLAQRESDELAAFVAAVAGLQHG